MAGGRSFYFRRRAENNPREGRRGGEGGSSGVAAGSVGVKSGQVESEQRYQQGGRKYWYLAKTILDPVPLFLFLRASLSSPTPSLHSLACSLSSFRIEGHQPPPDCCPDSYPVSIDYRGRLLLEISCYGENEMPDLSFPYYEPVHRGSQRV